MPLRGNRGRRLAAGAWAAGWTMRRILIALAVVSATAAVLAFAMARLASVECEVCVADEGRRVCRTVAAASRDQAVGTALTNACAVLGSNVTERLACERREPASQACRGG